MTIMPSGVRRRITAYLCVILALCVPADVLSQNGPPTEWVSAVDSLSDDWPGGMAIGREGEVYISGFVGAATAISGTSLGADSMFLAKLDPSGKVLWTHGGVGDIRGTYPTARLVLAKDGSLYLVSVVSGSFRF